MGPTVSRLKSLEVGIYDIDWRLEGSPYKRDIINVHSNSFYLFNNMICSFIEELLDFLSKKKREKYLHTEISPFPLLYSDQIIQIANLGLVSAWWDLPVPYISEVLTYL